MIFGLPFRMAQAPIGRHATSPRSLNGAQSTQPTAGTVKPLGVPGSAGGLPIDLLDQITIIYFQ